MADYTLLKDLTVPADSNITLSIEVTTDDDDFKLGGFSFVYLNATPKYNNVPGFEDLEIGKGSTIGGKVITAVTSVTKFQIDADDDDDLPNNCEVKYKIVVKNGDEVLYEEPISDTENFHFVVTATINLNN